MKNLNEMTLSEVCDFMEEMNDRGRPLRFSGRGDGKVVLKQDVEKNSTSSYSPFT
jgi:hypothetical protein